MASTHSLEYTHNTLEKSFGDYKAKGLTVNDVILGSGSAAQVHSGILTLPSNDHDDRNTTKAVAIKVLHPSTRQLVERDLALMQHIADFIDTCLPLEIVRMLSLPRAVANFSDIMKRQVDLRIEGDNLRRFRCNFDCSESQQSHSAIDFPQPIDGFISEHVLVEDHIDAKPISIYLADDSPRGLEVRKKLAGPLLRAFLKMVFVDNFVHADLHPGNVLVRESAQKDGYTIIFLDAGIAMSLDPRDKQNLHDLFKAVVLNHGYHAGSLMVERARYERCSTIPGGKHAFASGVADIVSDFHDRSKQGLTLGAVRVGSLLGRVLDLCRRYGVEIDPAMASEFVLYIENLCFFPCLTNRFLRLQLWFLACWCSRDWVDH
jgi:aarF domain-containing kinase